MAEVAKQTATKDITQLKAPTMLDLKSFGRDKGQEKEAEKKPVGMYSQVGFDYEAGAAPRKSATEELMAIAHGGSLPQAVPTEDSAKSILQRKRNIVARKYDITDYQR